MSCSVLQTSLLSRVALALVITGLASCQAVLGIDDVSGRQQDADPSAPDSDVPDAAPPDAEPSSCPAVFTEAYGGHGYFLSSNPRMYDEAVADCATAGGHLVVIEDVGENDFLRGLISADAWIGYDDQIVETRFDTVTGAELAYTNWDANQPDDYGDGEDCTGMRVGEGSWNDFPCSDLHLYVCECDPAALARPAPACMSDPAYDRILAGRRYRWASTTATWQGARDICVADGADLVVISDQDEQGRVAGAIPSTIWLGLWDPGEDAVGPFEWVIGDATYFNWEFGEPNDQSGQHHGVMAGSDGRWHDVSGSSAYSVMCECDPKSPAKNY